MAERKIAKNLTRRGPGVVSVALVSLLILSACGGAGDSEASVEAVGPSVEFGSEKEAYIEALSGLDEPIELVMQSSGYSASAYNGERDLLFAEEIYEWSDGQVDIEVAWSNSIAPLTEVDEALADGRLDLATYAYVYDRQMYPVANDISSSAIAVPASPLVGEMVADAALSETAWNTPGYLEEMENADLVPIVPFVPGGFSGLSCTQPRSSVNDFSDVQVRASMEAQVTQLSQLGAAPVSLDSGELYEAMQRGIIDCAAGALSLFVNSGIVEVAPDIVMPSEAPIAIGPQGFLAGPAFKDLPLAAQQLIFDKSVHWSMHNNQANKMYARDAAEAARDSGGEIRQLDTDTNDTLEQTNQEIISNIENSAVFDGVDYMTRLDESVESWLGQAEELGFNDDGNYQDFSDWFEGDLEKVDSDYLLPFYERVGESVISEHRPGA